MEWKDWSNVLFRERYSLPDCSGVYLIADANDCVWYIGQAANLKSRWAGRSHHRYPQLIRSNRQLCHKIYWKEFPINFLDEQERYYINLFQPELNGCKIKKYLPKQPQIEREIKRLLKVINKLTSLFNVIRSVVAGEYLGDGGIRCIVILININDYEIISNSMRKRYSPEVRKAWTIYKPDCGRDKDNYTPPWIPTYNFDSYRLEFVVTEWELFEYLANNSSAIELYVGITELFGIQVKALKDLRILDDLLIEEEYSYTNFDGKKILKSAAYINYHKHIFTCLQVP